jgi:hypothetical protein
VGPGTGVLPTGSRAGSEDGQTGPLTPPTLAPVSFWQLHGNAQLSEGLGSELRGEPGSRFSLFRIRDQYEGWDQGSVWDWGQDHFLPWESSGLLTTLPTALKITG